MSRRSRPAECSPSREPGAEGGPAAARAAGHELAMSLRAAYLTMHRRANVEFARFGLTADQFVILTALAEGGDVTQKELARRTASDANTMSEMLRRLERRGLVTRKRDEADGRARRVSLAASGREVQRRAWDGIAGFCETLAGLVPPDELKNLAARLRRIAGALTDPEG
ncbi:MAG: MarR family winged helix-turn-helix transcriptional regulator [Isosphaeraceae bacterium]